MSQPGTSGGPYLDPRSLPSDDNITFPDTGFFTKGHKKLPTPAEVREIARPHADDYRPLPVSFPSLGLIVKYGSYITISEGQCLWAIRRVCPSVPVPEVYGWCQDNGQTFIYMERIEGTTLEKEWPDLELEDKIQICSQLRRIINDLRQIRQDPSNIFIGTINQKPVQDILFENNELGNRVFPDVVSFQDWFARITEQDLLFPHPWRPFLLDDVPIVFTHSDLHQSNIIVSRDAHDNLQVKAIVDWHQSGWYPAPWEFYKTNRTAILQSKWDLMFIVEFLQSYTGYIAFSWFFHTTD